MTSKTIKVAVTGAAGNIGYALIFRIANGDVFGPDVGIDLSLIEIEKALPALEGVVMELQDCAFPLLKNVSINSDINAGFKDANWAVLVGAVPRKKGMERSDLLEINGGIFTEQGKAINKNAADDVRILVVGNPCNTNCLIAMNNAPDIPKNRWYAMTMLDENRAVGFLAKKADVSVTDVSNMIIWGNHSATQYPDFHNAQIKDKSVTEIIDDQKWLEETFISSIQQRGAEVIKARGSSSAASAANAIIDSLSCLYHDTPVGKSYSMCRCSEGEYNVDEGLIYSFPCRTKNGEVSPILGLDHNEFGMNKLRVTLDELCHERDVVKELKLI